MKMTLLRFLLMIDAIVLLLLGAAFMFAPREVEAAFHFRDLPPAVSYLIGLWGCVFATLAIGYGVAATDPVRHVVWVQVGIARGLLECIFGLVSLARGVVTLEQAIFGMIVAGLMTIAYLVLYPRAVVRASAPESRQPA